MAALLFQRRSSVAQDCYRAAYVLKDIQHNHHSGSAWSNRPGGLQIMNANVERAEAAAAPDRLRHDVEACDLVSEFVKSSQIRPSSYSTLDKSGGRRKVALQYLDDKGSLGNVPPVGMLQRDQLVKVIRPHGRTAPDDDMSICQI